MNNLNNSVFLPTGKVQSNSLLKHVFSHLGVQSDRLILGPAIGEDAAVLDLGDKVLVLATDPITAATHNIGWLSVHINANDIASCGAKPKWYLCSVLLPEKSSEKSLKLIMRQIDYAAKELNISVVGGHSEVTPAINHSILIGFMVGEAARDKYVTSSGARSGDVIILTKQAGIEGTAILATDLAEIIQDKIDQNTLNRAKAFINKISIVKEALLAADIGGISAMHDPTEGGIINGLWELAEASHNGITVHEDSIPVSHETKIICNLLNVDPLQILASGALLIVVKPTKVNQLKDVLNKEGIMSSVIGKIEDFKERRRLIKNNGSSIEITPPEQDPVYKLLKKYAPTSYKPH